MIVKVTLKDAEKREHIVEMHAADDTPDDASTDLELLAKASEHLGSWAAQGTTEVTEPLTLVSLERL